MMKRFGIYLLVICCLGTGVLADALLLEVNVIPEQAKQLFSMKETLSSRPGQPLDLQSVQEDIDELYLTGYFSDVSYQVTPFSGGKSLTYRVTLNPEITEVRFSGVTVGDEDLFRLVMSNQRGKILNYKALVRDKALIDQWYEERGYIYANVDQMSVDEGILNIKVTEGYIHSTSWEGLDPLKTKLLNRQLRQRKGTIYQERSAEQDRKQLLATDYFSAVSKPTVTEREDGLLDLKYWVEEKRGNMVDVGIEQLRYVDGVAIFGGLHWRNQFIDSDNLNLKAQFRLGNSVTLRAYSLYYQQPWFLNRYNLNFKLGIWDEFRREPFSGETESIENERIGGTLLFEKPFISEDVVLIFGGQIEDVLPVDDNFTPYSMRATRLGLRWDTRDDSVSPKQGFLVGATVASGGNLGLIDMGGYDFSRSVLNMSGFFSVSHQSVIALRTFYGDFYAHQDQDTFESEGFYLGGANSLRGYAEQQFNGDRRFSSSVEYRYQFKESVIGVLFVDGGKVFDRGTYSTENFKMGYGLGIRFLTGLLPIRLDLGYGEEWHLHFNLGQTF